MAIPVPAILHAKLVKVKTIRLITLAVALVAVIIFMIIQIEQNGWESVGVSNASPIGIILLIIIATIRRHKNDKQESN